MAFVSAFDLEGGVLAASDACLDLNIFSELLATVKLLPGLIAQSGQLFDSILFVNNAILLLKPIYLGLDLFEIGIIEFMVVGVHPPGSAMWVIPYELLRFVKLLAFGHMQFLLLEGQY